jgi:predicted amidohydrolase YtcJ
MKQSDSVRSRVLVVRVSLIATLLALVNCSGPDGEKVDSGGEVTLIVNADIVTINERQPSAEAMAVQDGRIIALGSLAEVRGAISGYEKFFDLEGRTVVPGFIETHDHLFMGSATSQIENISPFSTPTLSEALQKLSTIKPDQEGWVVAFGADQTLYEERLGPTRDRLDPLFPNTPVIVYHLSGHAAFMNSEAMRLSGIDETTPNPIGGYYEKDADGRLTGYLSGQPAFLTHKPYPTPTLAAAIAASDARAAKGITTSSELAIMNAFVLNGLSKATNDPNFATRMVGGYFSTASDFDEIVPLLHRYENDLLTIRFIKTWTDGSPQGGTANLRDGYYDPAMGSGGAQGSQDYFNELVRDIYLLGYWPAVHANGDGAVDVALNAIEYAQQAVSANARARIRPQIIHAQVSRPDQLKRMAALGVSPTFFTTHVYFWGDLYSERIVGPKLIHRLSAMGDAFRAGVRPSMHNDYPVSPVNPIMNMWIAVNRTSSSGKVLGADQAISPLQALKAYTIHAAYQFGMDKDAGTLEVGKLADFVILDQNPLKIDPGDIRDVRVLATVLGGRVTYSEMEPYDRVAP